MKRRIGRKDERIIEKDKWKIVEGKEVFKEREKKEYEKKKGGYKESRKIGAYRERIIEGKKKK